MEESRLKLKLQKIENGNILYVNNYSVESKQAEMYEYTQNKHLFLSSRDNLQLIDEIYYLQLLGREITIYNKNIIYQPFPEGYSDVHKTTSSSFDRVDMKNTIFSSLMKDLNCQYISPALFYSKEAVLTVALLEAALRSDYPRQIISKFPSFNFSSNKYKFRNLYENISKIEFFKKAFILFQDLDLHNIDHLKKISEDFSICIKFHFFENERLKSYFSVPENAEISPIPKIKIIEYKGNYSVLYTDEENLNDGFSRGECDNNYGREEIQDSFFFQRFLGYKESFFFDLVYILGLLGKGDQNSKAEAKKAFDNVFKSIEEFSTTGKNLVRGQKDEYFSVLNQLNDAKRLFTIINNHPSASNIIKKSPNQNLREFGKDLESIQEMIDNDLKKPTNPPPQYPKEIKSSTNPSSYDFIRPPAAIMNNPPNPWPSGVAVNKPMPLNTVKPSPIPEAFNGLVPNNPSNLQFSGNTRPPESLLYSNQNFGQGHMLPNPRLSNDHQLQGPGNMNLNPMGNQILLNKPSNGGMSSNYFVGNGGKSTCSCCNYDKPIVNFHGTCNLCYSCIAQSVNEKMCLECNKNDLNVINAIRTFRNIGFKCSTCGIMRQDVEVNQLCKCIVCKTVCKIKLENHNYHIYQ